MPSSRLLGWFAPDDCETCAACGEKAAVSGANVCVCLACGAVWLVDGKGERALLAPSQGVPPPSD